MEFKNYQVKEEDTLVGIALKHNMPLSNFLRINKLTENSFIYPGMTLKVIENPPPKPIPSEKPQQEDFCSSKLFKVPVHYCTPEGDVKGVLTVTDQLVMFDPCILEKFYCTVSSAKGKTKELGLHFQACIDLQDTVSCNVIEVPGYNAESPDQDKKRLFFLQMLLLRTGKEKRLISDSLPKVNVYFRLSHLDLKGFHMTYQQQKASADYLVSQLKSKTVPKLASSCTYVPFFDCNKSYKRLKEEEFQDTCALEDPEFVPCLSHNSEVLKEGMLAQVVSHLPSVLQLRNWELVYSPVLHGSSINVFYKRTKGTGPTVMLVEDQDHHVFGGFASETWEPKKHYYGTGECFVFSFHKGNVMKSYPPTMSNEFYMNANWDFLSMGARGDSSLFIDKELMNGHSGRSETYDNEVLSSRSDFNIIKLEVWALV